MFTKHVKISPYSILPDPCFHLVCHTSVFSINQPVSCHYFPQCLWLSFQPQSIMCVSEMTGHWTPEWNSLWIFAAFEFSAFSVIILLTYLGLLFTVYSKIMSWGRSTTSCWYVIPLILILFQLYKQLQCIYWWSSFSLWIMVMSAVIVIRLFVVVL